MKKNSFQRYLNHICATLQTKGWLDTLYAVQIGINDNMRAAITCVKLYLRPTQSPHVEALHVRGHRLAQAAGHLQSVTKRDSIPGNDIFALTSNLFAFDKKSCNLILFIHRYQ